jgi:hypothetical protein
MVTYYSVHSVNFFPLQSKLQPVQPKSEPDPSTANPSFPVTPLVHEPHPLRSHAKPFHGKQSHPLTSKLPHQRATTVPKQRHNHDSDRIEVIGTRTDSFVGKGSAALDLLLNLPPGATVSDYKAAIVDSGLKGYHSWALNRLWDAHSR